MDHGTKEADLEALENGGLLSAFSIAEERIDDAADAL